MSKTFYTVVVCLCICFLYAQGIVARYHLNLEQAWSQELLDQNTHTLGIVAKQKDHINTQYGLIKEQATAIEMMLVVLKTRATEEN